MAELVVKGDRCQWKIKFWSHKPTGMATVRVEEYRHKIFLVEWVSDRLMAIRTHISIKVVNVVTAHALQTRRNDGEKGRFWKQLRDFVSAVSKHEIILPKRTNLGGRILQNGNDASDCHRNHGCEIRNKGGEQTFECARTRGLILTNTYLTRWAFSHLRQWKHKVGLLLGSKPKNSLVARSSLVRGVLLSKGPCFSNCAYSVNTDAAMLRPSVKESIDGKRRIRQALHE